MKDSGYINFSCLC